MIFISNAVINMLETPGIIADTSANTPNAADTQIGVLFIATDTLLMYRNDGTTWQPLGGGGAAGIDTVLGIGNVANDKTQTFTDGAGDYELNLSKLLIQMFNFLNGQRVNIDTNNINVSDAAGDFIAGVYSSSGAQSLVYARTDKYGIFFDPALQKIYFNDYSSSKILNLIFPSSLSSNQDIYFPDATGTAQLQLVYGGNIDLTLSNYTIASGSINQYFRVTATGAGDIDCDNMQLWPDGSEVQILADATSFYFTYTLGNFNGEMHITKRGLITLKVLSTDIYCSVLG